MLQGSRLRPGAAWLITAVVALLVTAVGLNVAHNRYDAAQGVTVAGAVAADAVDILSLPPCPDERGPAEPGQTCLFDRRTVGDASEPQYVLFTSPCPDGVTYVPAQPLCVDSVTGIEHR